MNYISTRISKESINFKKVTLKGLASDGGLYIPEMSNDFNLELIDKNLTFQQTAFKVINAFVGKSINKKNLNQLINKSYCCFRNKEITPITKLDEKNYLLELYHGPTLAFKDIALQFLGNTFELFLQKSKKKLTIVGATSGDTGSAAINAVKNNKFVNIFILHPYNRISDFQRRQMTTVSSKNVFNIAVKGTFDDCQNIIKNLFIDNQLNKNLKLGSINSINWTRIMAQVTYYIYAFNKIKKLSKNTHISFSVPTGNFGDAYAGFIAKEKFKIPIKKIIVATNNNNILDKFFKTGQYKKKKVFKTISPSMDIQIASNFERLLFDMNKRNGKVVNKLMTDFKKLDTIKVSKHCFNKSKKNFISESINEKSTKSRIEKTFKKYKKIIDPHTAVGLEAANKYLKENKNDLVITLATAHPSKFSSSVNSILGIEPELPKGYKNIFKLKEKYEILENSYNLISNFIVKNSIK